MANNYNKNQTSTAPMSEEEKVSLLKSGTLILLGILLLSFFFGWCYIFNTDHGVEVGVNGWNFICMSFSWDFKSTASVFGDMAVPFYYYAKYYTIVLTIMTTVVFYLTLILVVLSFLNMRKNNALLTKMIITISIINTVMLLACFVTALTMNGSRILPRYCSSNPACSIQSLVIFPFLLSILIPIINGILLKKISGKA